LALRRINNVHRTKQLRGFDSHPGAIGYGSGSRELDGRPSVEESWYRPVPFAVEGHILESESLKNRHKSSRHLRCPCAAKVLTRDL
jgi:hypothetical protein